jgi:hypothetical protein
MMTDDEFRDEAALRAMECFLSKIPVPGLPGGMMGNFNREEFLRQIKNDCQDVALAMLLGRQERRTPQEPPVYSTASGGQ